MKKLIILFCVLLSVKFGFSQSTCETAHVYCGANQSYNAEVTGTDLGAFDCMSNSPDPTWFVLQIDQPGDVNISIVGTGAGSGLDLDLAVIGPYSSINCPDITDSLNDNPFVYCDWTTASGGSFTIAGATSGQIYFIIVPNYNGEVGTADFTNTSTATFNCSVGINENNESEIFEFSVVNPFIDYLNLSGIPFNSALSIYDMAGREVYFNKNVSDECSINLSHLNAGLFLVEVKDSEGRRSMKKVIKN